MATIRVSDGQAWHSGSITKATDKIYGVVKFATEDEVLNGVGEDKAINAVTINNVVENITDSIEELSDETVKLDGDQEINGVKTFNSTLNVSNNITIRTYGSNDSGRLQIRAQPSDNVIRGTFAITDAFEGYDGWVSQMVSRSGDLSTDEINTLRVSEKGVEYIRQESNGDVISNNKLLDTSTLTNCITEVPQDIKLELVDGVLTLKTGSKLTEITETQITTTQDYVVNVGQPTGQRFLFARNLGNIIAFFVSISENTFSGSTQPTPITATAYWYDTVNKVMKNTIDTGQTWGIYSGSTFPIASVIFDNGKVTSIDQVFNGFGYIGSTVFVLPGVKGLIPNGRNADGTLKNTEVSTDNVKTRTLNASNTGDWYLALNPNITWADVDNVIYDEESNIITNWGACCIYGRMQFTNGVITSFTPKLSFRAVDQNDFNRLDEEVVKTSGNQTVGGDKNFTGTLTQNGNTVATTNNTVNLMGNQTINDVKTFLNAPTIKTTVADSRITTKNESFKIGETVSENSFSGFKGVDADGTEYANCNCSYNTSGRVGCNFYVKRSDSGTLVEGSLGIYIDKNGTSAYTIAPTPATNDNSTKIATTAWFNQKIQVVSTLPASPDSNVYYFVTG